VVHGVCRNGGWNGDWELEGIQVAGRRFQVGNSKLGAYAAVAVLRVIRWVDICKYYRLPSLRRHVN
jgi:hypothetical protein